MTLLDFITQYWSSIVVVVAFIVVCVILIKKGYSKYVKQILFYLVCKAEEEYGGGTGALKYAAVTSWLYEKLPAICKIFFTKKQVDMLIESAVTEMKEWLTKNNQANAFITKNAEETRR